jgi:PHD/YefM family antitoxin component YafN of YafNO toxin-antitoxin module
LSVLRRAGSPRRKYRHCRDETAHLLSTPENARRLMAAMREAESGDGIPGSSADEARDRANRF